MLIRDGSEEQRLPADQNPHSNVSLGHGGKLFLYFPLPPFLPSLSLSLPPFLPPAYLPTLSSCWKQRCCCCAIVNQCSVINEKPKPKPISVLLSQRVKDFHWREGREKVRAIGRNRESQPFHWNCDSFLDSGRRLTRLRKLMKYEDSQSPPQCYVFSKQWLWERHLEALHIYF